LSQSILDQLSLWNQSFSTNPSEESLVKLRRILGEINQDFDKISYVIRKGFRSFSEDLIPMAREVLPLINNIDVMKNLLDQTKSFLESNKASLMQIDANRTIDENAGYFAQQEIKNRLLSDNLWRVADYLITSLQNTNISNKHIQFINKIASNEMGSVVEKIEEADEERQGKIQKQTMYSISNASELTLKVLRETLQNASDAVLDSSLLNSGNYTPTIEVFTNTFALDEPDEKAMDLVVRDNGIGMDVDTLRNKFFVWFATGKEEKKGDTGGFGIGKRLILETPEQGWSIATRNNFSNKSSRNSYLSRNKHEVVDDLDLYFPKVEAKNGTTLALYYLPATQSYTIETLCKSYATNSRLKIILNGIPIVPAFPIDKLQLIESGGDAISTLVSKNEYQEGIVKDLVNKQGQDFLNNLGGLHFDHEGSSTDVKFYVAPASDGFSSGKSYFMMNGNYQFSRNANFPKVNIICDIRSTARPDDSGYPMDQSRDNVREPYNSQIDSVLGKVKVLLEQITKSQIFQDGLEIYTVNGTSSPLSTSTSKKQDGKDKLLHFMGHSDLFNKEKSSKQEIIQSVQEAIRVSDSPEKVKILQGLVNTVREMDDDKIIKHDDLGTILDGLSTPCNINIQKNFVSKEIAYQRVDLTKNLIILWKEIIELIIGQSNFMVGRWDEKEYIPGLIYSDEALALYSPPSHGSTFHCLSINPISVAAMLNPSRFEKVIRQQKPETFKDQVQFEEESNIKTDNTPTIKLTNMLYHEAVHEVTHFLFPDASYDMVNFHKYITKIEYLCAPIYDDIRLAVKRYLQGIKKDSNELITQMKKDMNNKNVESSVKNKLTIKMSKKKWESIGKIAGWIY